VDRLSLGLGLIVLDEESAVGLDRVDGTGTPMEREVLGAWMGARLSKGGRL
jgi:hypothetical protein